MVFENFILCILGEQQLPGSIIDSGISDAVKGSTKLSVTKSVFDGRMGTTITAEKDPAGFKRNSTDLRPNYGCFKQQACDFSIEKVNLPEITAFYINQAYVSYKDNEKTYYCDVFILGPVTPMLNPPEDLKNYIPKENEATIVRPKYDVVSGQFFGLVETLGYFTVCGDKHECFFDYGYSKENIEVLYSMYKMNIWNSFSATIFNRHRIQYEAGALLDTDFSKIFFFLPSTTDRVEDINRYMTSVNLMPIDIEPSEFGKDFDPSTLDFENSDGKK